MDRVEYDLWEMCSSFLQLLDILRDKGIISDFEYETHAKFKKLFIHQEKSKLSI